MQVACLERGELVEEEATTSGRPFEGSHIPISPPGAWSSKRLGLMSHLNPTAVLWAMLTGSTEALLTVCGDLVNTRH